MNYLSVVIACCANIVVVIHCIFELDHIYGWFLIHRSTSSSSSSSSSSYGCLLIFVDINRYQMTFSWNPVRLSACEAVQYYILHTNCGICPNTTNVTIATCTDYNINHENVCTFAIQSVVCSDVVGPMSNVTTVALKGNDILICLRHFTL